MLRTGRSANRLSVTLTGAVSTAWRVIQSAAAAAVTRPPSLAWLDSAGVRVVVWCQQLINVSAVMASLIYYMTAHRMTAGPAAVGRSVATYGGQIALSETFQVMARASGEDGGLTGAGGGAI